MVSHTGLVDTRILPVAIATEANIAIPENSILLGIDENELPVVLNTNDPVCGSILITADVQAGKTMFLKSVAAHIHQAGEYGQMEFGVISPHPEEWEDWTSSSDCVGIFTPNAQNADVFILALAAWMERKAGSHPIFLLIDNLEAIQNLRGETQEALQQIITTGPSRNIWTLATLTSGLATNINTWLTCFRSRLLGFSANNPCAATLIRGDQFALLDGSDWIKFSIGS